MDKFVSILKEGEENLLKKLTDDEKKNYFENQISIVSIQNFREDNIECQKMNNHNRIYHSMILFQLKKQGIKIL